MTQNPAVLGSRHIFLLPSRSGLLFSIALAALLLGAINYANALAYLLTFLLASMALVSVLHTQGNLLNLEITVVAEQPVFAGGQAQFRVCLHNPGRARFAVRVEIARVAAQTVNVPARDTCCVPLSLPAVQRGWLPCPKLVLATYYPLGLVRAWSRRLVLPARCLVYPQPAAVAELAPAAVTDGESRPTHQANGEDFYGLRTYQPGDALTRISWKTLARGQGLYSKEYNTPAAESLWLDWQLFAPHDTETRLRLLTRALLDAETAGLQYGLRLPGVTLDPDGGPAHRARCLQALALHALDDPEAG